HTHTINDTCISPLHPLPPRPPCTSLFPYTTLFRSREQGDFPRALAEIERLRRLRDAPDGLRELEIATKILSGDLPGALAVYDTLDRKSTRLNSSHQIISYAVFCLKKKKITDTLM